MKNKKTKKHNKKHMIKTKKVDFVLANYSCAWGLPGSTIDTPDNNEVKKADFSFKPPHSKLRGLCGRGGRKTERNKGDG